MQGFTRTHSSGGQEPPRDGRKKKKEREKKEGDGDGRGDMGGRQGKARDDGFFQLRDDASQPVNATNPRRNLPCTPCVECTGATLHEQDLV